MAPEIIARWAFIICVLIAITFIAIGSLAFIEPTETQLNLETIDWGLYLHTWRFHAIGAAFLVLGFLLRRLLSPKKDWPIK